MERGDRKMIEIMKTNLHPVLLHEELIGSSDRAVIFQLPYNNSRSTLEALNELPFPIVAVDRVINLSFPADMGTMIGRTLYTRRSDSRMLNYLMAAVGISIDYKTHPLVQTPQREDKPMAEGGTLAIDNRSRRAITSSVNSFTTLQQEQYHTMTISPDIIVAFARLFPKDWVYQVFKEGWFGGFNAHIDGLTTLFSDIRGQLQTVTDKNVFAQFRDVTPDTWNIEPIDHSHVLGGALNIAYIDDYVLAPPRENMGDLAKKLDRSGYNLIHLPSGTVADKAGPKCRTLVVPL